MDGISEQELLAILGLDKCVLEEINNLAHWKVKYNYFTLSVLWARIYYDLKGYLAEVDSDGILLLRFHHDLIRQTVIDMAGQELLTQLSCIMSHYFSVEPTYLNRTQNTVMVNKRKLRELFPAMIYHNDWDAAADVLADPKYVEGYLRCGWYRDLMVQFAALGQKNIYMGYTRKYYHYSKVK